MACSYSLSVVIFTLVDSKGVFFKKDILLKGRFEMNLGDIITRNIKRFPEKMVLIFEEMSYISKDGRRI